MGFIVDPARGSLPTDHLRRAYDYWEALRPGAGLPRREDFDPGAILPLLPNVNLVDVRWHGGVRRYRHRLVGTGVADYFRTDSTGRWFDEVYTPAHLQRQLPAYERAACDAAPNVDIVVVPLTTCANGPDLMYWRLILPMTRTGGHADMLFLLFDPVLTDPKHPGRLPLYLDAAADH
ncbi:MAG: PAS domain-containing protein [Alphaproteobacteria bacterium]